MIKPFLLVHLLSFGFYFITLRNEGFRKTAALHLFEIMKVIYWS